MGEHDHDDCDCHDRAPKWHESLFDNLFSEEAAMILVVGGLMLIGIIAAIRGE